MIEPSYEDRLLAAYEEGRTAAFSGSEFCRFTPGTPMHAAWEEGRTEALSDRGWQKVGDVARSVVKAAVVESALNGTITQERADEIVSAPWLKNA